MKNDSGIANKYNIAVRQFRQQILPGGYGTPSTDARTSSRTQLSGATVPTPTRLPRSRSIRFPVQLPAYTNETIADVPVKVRWINGLVDKQGRFLPHILPIDQTLHWANPPMLCIDGTSKTDCRGFIPQRYTGPVPIVTHVHGSNVEGHSDGYPEAWWLPKANNIPKGYATKGTLFDDATGTNPGTLGYADFEYRNDQPATTLWYHDHTLGMTRSNVYAGPAGFWLVRGGPHDGATAAGITAVLPGPAPVAGEGVMTVNLPKNLGGEREKYREIPIVIQDRSFNADGSLFYPETRAFFEGVTPKQLQIPFIPNDKSDISPIWNPEAFFNVMVVNGVSWPKLEVAPPSTSPLPERLQLPFLWLKFSNPKVKVWQIAPSRVPPRPGTDEQQSRRERRRHGPTAHGPGRAG